MVVGASVRAAAASAIRAGFTPLAIDRFTDADLVQACAVTRGYQQPHQILDILSALPLVSWMYTGSLENHPRLVECISESRELLGNSAAVLRQVRDPRQLHAALQAADLLMPAVCQERPARNVELWLLKPRRSGGGLGIRRGTTDRKSVV